MTEKINFLYCFDENYNLQAFSSMISILDKVTEKIDIHIIHTTNSFKDNIPKIILDHKNLENLNSYQFNDYEHKFPNTEDVHITVATYFRLFIKNYLDKSLSNVVFIDPDVICLNDPVEELKNIINKLYDSKYLLAAKTEHRMGVKTIGVERNYFNAGIMVIAYNKWLENNIHDKLLLKLDSISNNIVQWDQDVLNSYFNGNYIELDRKFNFKASKKVKKNEGKILFLHYIGSHKPWLTSGTFTQYSNYYHLNYRKYSNSNFHIIHKWKTRSILDLLKAIFTLKILKIKGVFKFLIEFIKSLFL